MKYRLSDIERKVLALIQYGMPLTLTPFEDMASDIGLESEQIYLSCSLFISFV